MNRRQLFAGLLGLGATASAEGVRKSPRIAGDTIEAGDPIRFGSDGRIYPEAVLKYDPDTVIPAKFRAASAALVGDWVWVYR